MYYFHVNQNFLTLTYLFSKYIQKRATILYTEGIFILSHVFYFKKFIDFRFHAFFSGYSDFRVEMGVLISSLVLRILFVMRNYFRLILRT